MSSKSLSTIPSELVLLVGEDLGAKDLKSFMQVNSTFCRILTPVLHNIASKPRHRKTALYWGAVTGNRDLVKSLVKKGKSFLAKKDDEDKTLIFKAPERHHVEEVVDIILEQGSRLIVHDTFDSSTPLQDAARHDHGFLLRSLLDMGADPSARDFRGWTALHHAAWESNKFAVKLLLERGANRNAQEKEKMTPLHFSALLGDKQITKLLLAAGANVALKNTQGFTAIELTDGEDHDMTSLILKKAGPGFRSSTEQTALHLAACVGNIDVGEAMLTKGVDINARDMFGNTALHEAAASGYIDLVKLLLAEGAEVNAQDQNGVTPLHFSLATTPTTCTESIAIALLEKDADVNIRDNNGDSPFCYLANSMEARSFELLTEMCLKKVDISFRTRSRGRTALHLAVQYSSVECVQMLLERGANATEIDTEGWNSLHFAAVGPSDEIKIQLFLDLGLDATTKTSDGKTVIDIACEYGNVRSSLLQTADINFRTIDKQQSLLHLAAQVGDKTLAKLLLDKGIDANLQDNNGSTALHFAAFTLDEDYVQLLLDGGADNTIHDVNGMTPVCELLRMIEGGDLSRELVRLLAKGFNLDERDAEGLTLLDHAAEYGHDEGVEALQEMGSDFMDIDSDEMTASELEPLHKRLEEDNRQDCLDMNQDESEDEVLEDAK